LALHIALNDDLSNTPWKEFQSACFVRPFREGDEESIAHIHNEGFKEWIESLTIYYGYRYIHSDDVRNWRGKDGPISGGDG